MYCCHRLGLPSQHGFFLFLSLLFPFPLLYIAFKPAALIVPSPDSVYNGFILSKFCANIQIVLSR
jgi:hypothetical protein